MAKNKTRLDVALVEQGFAESREKAKAIIMSGIVYVNNQKSDKAGKDVKDDDVIEVRGKTLKYVSRGGLKLEKAMECFPITLEGKICMDVGASTGGFTDCMLMNGAVKVYSVDDIPIPSVAINSSVWFRGLIRAMFTSLKSVLECIIRCCRMS